jgi:2-methylcitrate dehydratase PrpD
MLTAVVAGYEVCARVGEAVIPESYYFWHTTGTVGAIGAGASAAKILGLDGEQTLQCLGSAGTQAAGLWEFVKEGAMSKPLHTGKSSYAGVLSAYLAKEGFTGATKILEGDKGFCKAMVAKPHLEKLTAGLGKGFKIDDNSFKPYPCCKHSHASLYALQVLQQENKFTAKDVAKVEVLVNSITDSLINNPNPQTAYGCKFSIQYCDASVLKFGNVTIENFTPKFMEDKDVRALMKLINVHQDKAVQKVYDDDPSKLATKVIVTLKDGRSFKKKWIIRKEIRLAP